MQGSKEIDVILASRWSRFWAAFIDGLAMVVVYLPVFFIEPLGKLFYQSNNYFLEFSYFVMGYLLMHGYLLHKYGQTIGKNVFEISIVGMDNQPMGLKEIMLKRWCPTLLMGLIPFLGLIDILFIFRSDRRCLHDLVAKSKVIDISKPDDLEFSQAD
ncbi:RDD family protein [Vibrio tapetis subsp. quintayensis]|uniref:RDD family protein n=1 Tax=Vibrio tapetis TaxID=52443 RepID=UPI0025B2870F|nr:RDD family protein [Vibrio tapetis]MDN3681796.1 RDD family protein [Vibrio tapetis subsp. quintayensis]